MNVERSINELRKFFAPEFIFGEHSLSLVGNYIKKFGINRVLVVSDSGVISAGWTESVINSIDNSSIDYVLFSEISPNPRDTEVSAGATLYMNKFCDGIIAIGGGSVMDAAKGIGIEAVNQRNILEFEGVNKVILPMPPLICMPTTGGTASEVSQFSIINNVNEKYKIAIISKAVVPDLAIIDPVTLTSMDSYLTACTGVDAVVHAVEAYCSTGGSRITDNYAIDALNLLGANLLKSIEQPNNLEYRSNVMLASLEAGLAFSNAGLGIVHSMAHSLGGYLDLPHGECNAMLLNTSIDFNYNSDMQSRYSNIAIALGMSNNNGHIYSKSDIMKFIFDFKLSVGINNQLSNKGVKIDDIETLSEKALYDPCLATNPRIPNLADIQSLYKEAM
jgi:alcohol dehydrogenase